jgi:hypothetical protein
MPRGEMGRLADIARRRYASLTVLEAWAVPWIKDDIPQSLKTSPPSEVGSLLQAAFGAGLFPRWNGSPIYPTKIPDLIGIKDRKYIDHTVRRTRHL